MASPENQRADGSGAIRGPNESAQRAGSYNRRDEGFSATQASTANLT